MAQMLALYKTAESAAQATEALDGAGVTNEEWDVLTDCLLYTSPRPRD